MSQVDLIQRLSLAAVVLLLAVPIRLLAADAPGEEKVPALLKARPLEPGKNDDEVRKVVIARYNAALAELQARHQEYLAGRGTMDILYGASHRVLESGLEVHTKPADQITLREQHLEVVRELDNVTDARFNVGRVSIADREQARYYYLDAELQLLRAKRKAAGKP